MMSQTTVKKSELYALLIGINYYLPNPCFRNLKGAVRDINLVDDYLQKALKIPRENILKLYSPSPGEPQPPVNQLPTYENIVIGFSRITQQAQPGDQIYIHYSGHGGRAQTIYPEIKSETDFDETIAPMDLGEEGHHLRDIELITLLKRMTDKGLIVTLIFDSCHSGGLPRGDVAIRGGDPDLTPRTTESLVASREELLNNWRMVTESGNRHPVNQWGSARDYVFLAACRLSESAFEYNIDGQRHGALTYWLINTLTSSVPGLSYQDLYDRVSAKIQSKFPQQMPMMIGEANRLVFGSETVSLQYAVTVNEVITVEDQQRVRLGAGMETGLGAGARFAIYPLGTNDFRETSQQLAIVEVETVEVSESWGVVINRLKPGELESGAKAVMLSPPVDLVRHVRLVQSEHCSIEHQQALEAVARKVETSGWLKVIESESDRENYQVAINADGDYEICTGTPIKNLRPPLKITDPNSAQKVVDRLVHLVKYQAVQELGNPFSELSRDLSVELLIQPHWQPGMVKNPQPMTSHPLRIKSGEYVFLRIKNEGAGVVNIAVLDLEATWAISRIQLMKPAQIFYPFNPGQEELIPLCFQIPVDEKYQQVTEVLKIFSLVGKADFRWLELPALDEVISAKSGVFRDDNPLAKLMEVIGTDVDDRPELTRAAIPVLDSDDEWGCRELQITITSD